MLRNWFGRSRFVWSSAAIVASAAAVGAPVPAEAAPAVIPAPLVIAVTRYDDDHDAGSLRAAIDQANGARPVPASVTIKLAAGTYDLTRCATEDDANVSGDLDSTGGAPVTIVARAGVATIHQTCAGERVLQQLGAPLLTLQHLAITGGSLRGTDPQVRVAGGGVRAAGQVHLVDTTLTGNTVTAAGGRAAAGSSPAIPGGTALGGGLYAAGDVVMQGSRIETNTVSGGVGAGDPINHPEGVGGDAIGGGMAVLGAATVIFSTVRNNHADAGTGAPPTSGGPPAGTAGGSARGGGISSASNARVAVAVFDGNVASGGDSPFFLSRGGPVGPAGGPAHGGGIDVNGTLSVWGSQFLRNRAEEGIGASGEGSHGGAAFVTGDTAVALSTLDGNVANRHQYAARRSFGGAIATNANLNLSEVSASANLAEYGGAFDVAGTLSANGSRFARNRAVQGGGARVGGSALVATSAFVENHLHVTLLGNGAGLEVVGAVVIDSSVFTDNRADADDADAFLAVCAVVCDVGDRGTHGGAVHSGTGITALRSTFSGNVVNGGIEGAPPVLFGTAGGGALSAPAVNLRDSTLDDNASIQVVFAQPAPTSRPGAGGSVEAPLLGLTHVTLTRSSGEDAVAVQQLFITASVLHAITPPGAPQCAPGVATLSGGFNRVDDPSCLTTGNGDVVDATDPLLGPLQANGGPTPTRLPGAGSPLVDVTPIGSPVCIGQDQRGVARPQGPACDIGSVERAERRRRTN